MSSSLFWILLLYTLAGIVTVTESTTCWYDDSYGREYIYCPHSACCGTYSKQYCCTGTGTIVGAVLGCLAFVVIVASIITCCCCACCPVYQHRTRGTVITTYPAGSNYQTVPETPPYAQNTGPYTAQPAGAYTAPPPYQV